METHTQKKILATGAVLLAGALLSFLIQFNAGLAQRIGALESSFVAHFVGAVVAFGFVAMRFRNHTLQRIQDAPKFLFLGGLLGVLVTVAANVVVPKLGVLLYSSILIALDLMFSTLADHFGFFGLPRFRMNFKRVLGLMLALVGVGFIFWM